MRYALVMPGIGATRDWPTREEAEEAKAAAEALGVSDAWVAMFPDESELDGTAGEGC